MISPAWMWAPTHPVPRRRPQVKAWLDVSNWQAVLTSAWFRQWHAAGYGGLIVQGVVGNDGISYTRQQLQGALNHGWRIAGYVWLKHDDPDGLEARLDLFDGFDLDFLALDVETLDLTIEDIDNALDACEDYLKRPEDVWIYTRKQIFDALGLSTSAYWVDYKLWAAIYDGTADPDVGFDSFGGWPDCDMKQFTDGKPPTGSGNVDQNVMRV